jgi:hypothetical protein
VTLPGVEVINRESPPPRSAPTDTGVWFVTGLTEKGPLTPTLVRSLNDFTRIYGGRVGYSVLYDAVEGFFREGGARIYVSRVVGPNPVSSFVVLNDSGAAATLRVQASSVGDWANGATGGLKVQVVAGANAGEFVLVVTLNGVEVTRSPSLVDKVAAIAWAEGNQYITLIDQASTNDPAIIGATNLTGGTDDRAAVTDTQWGIAIDRFTTDLGTGMVSAPGRTTNAAYIQIMGHGITHNRVPKIDAIDSPTLATLTSAAAALRGLVDKSDRFTGMFWPWAVVPGILPGTTRTIPPCAVAAGIAARNDGSGLSPNTAAAGENGQSRWAIGLSQQPFNDADRETLNNSGVNVMRFLYGGVRVYGYRTLADPELNPNWTMLSNSRLYTAIAAQANAIAERFTFAELDGQRRKVNEFGGVLAGMLLPYWTRGSLYGATPQEAFNVDVGAQVNTDATLAAGELHAVIALRMSPFAERVILEIVKTAPTEAVA